MICRTALLFLLTLSAPLRAGPELCEAAARQAAQESGLPPALLLAISMVETGRAFAGERRPWPWSANLEGQGHRFTSRAELADFARRAIDAGRSNLDIGCFQINWRWHGASYSGPEALTDPLTGARHAARYLLELQREHGSRAAAIGAYHSRDPQRAARYLALIEAAIAAQPRGRPDALPPARPGPSLAAALLSAPAARRPFLSLATP